MRCKFFVATIAAFVAAYGIASAVRAEPAPVVQVSDATLDAELVALEGAITLCGCDKGVSKDGKSKGSCDGSCSAKGGKGTADACAPWTLFPELPSGITVSGWLEIGGAAGADRSPSRNLRPVTFGDRQDVTVNQLYTVIERSLDTSCGWDIGGRVDILFGTDARFTEVPGLELERDGSASKWNSHTHYRISTPQAYAEIGNGNWSAKIGHWYTSIGYEVVTAPDNFFYSHAYTMAYGEPFTHTGVLVNYDLNDRVSAHGAIHSGWDSFDGSRERAGFLGGVNWTSEDERTGLALAFTTGDQVNNANAYSNRSMYSIVITRQLSDDLTYVFQHDNAWQNDDQGPGADSEWYGINQYLLYTLNDCWSMGARLEWFRDDDGVRVPNWAGNTGLSGSYWEATFGMNWMPGTNLTLRPELRWDWFDGAGNPYDDGQSNDQFTASFDAILLF
ncbi:MAG: porin [Planctomycetes bacterium]|nr:porin [Planctomycetota bacterium]